MKQLTVKINDFKAEQLSKKDGTPYRMLVLEEVGQPIGEWPDQFCAILYGHLEDAFCQESVALKRGFNVRLSFSTYTSPQGYTNQSIRIKDFDRLQDAPEERPYPPLPTQP